MNKVFNGRKNLYLVLIITIISIFALTVAYSALSTVLKITGNTEVVASNWDIYLDNVQLVSGSATSSVPTIIDKTTVSFNTTLKNPGDYYMFTVDVVNNGSIDAIIDSIEKTPTLTESQSKYLNYIVEYQNGNSISTKQLVEKNSYVRLKVRIGFRTDISASDIPQVAETLNFSFKVKYIQSDDSNENVIVNNDGKLIKVISGDYDTVGSEICIGEECFYVISNDNDSVTMLAKYNLYVGNSVSSSLEVTSLSSPTGIQDERAIASEWDESYNKINFPWIGTVEFSSENYWSSKISSYPAYVYDSNSTLYDYVENYRLYLLNQGVEVEESRLIKLEELTSLGCSGSSCKSAPSWVYKTSYWSGSAYDSDIMVFVSCAGVIGTNNYFPSQYYGVRPVIRILKSKL